MCALIMVVKFVSKLPATIGDDHVASSASKDLIRIPVSDSDHGEILLVVHFQHFVVRANARRIQLDGAALQNRFQTNLRQDAVL